MTDYSELLARVRAGLDGVTDGPWGMETKRTSCGVCHQVGPWPHKWRAGDDMSACIYDDYPSPPEGTDNMLANARFIAAARSDVPALADALEAVMNERDSFRAVLEGARYGNIDGIAKNDPEFSYQLGEAVMELTMARMKRAEAAEAEAASLKAEVARLREALVEIDALDPEHLIDGCAQTAMRGLVLRMGEIARDAMRAKKEAGG